MLDWGDVRILYLRELRSALRERSIVANSILLPVFLYPLILWLAYTAISFVGGQTEGYSSRVTLRGLPSQHLLLKMDLEQVRRFQLTDSTDPVADIRDGRLDALVEFVPSAVSLSVRITFDDSKDRSRIAKDRIAERISRYRDHFLEKEAERRGITPASFQGFWTETENVASTRQMGQYFLGMLLPVILIVMLSVGCMFPAIDSTAGEREKSTWETSMTAATARSNIVAAKYLYVATMAAAAGILNITAMAFSMGRVMAPLLRLRPDLEELTFQVPLASIPLVLLVTVLLALFVAAGMMILASFARTFREGQSMVAPFYVLTFLPAAFLQVPGIEFTPKLALIPIVNVIMVFREAVVGVYHWWLIGITLAVEVACIVLALRLAAAILRHEDFILGTHGGNFTRFVKERLLASGRSRGGIR